MENANPKQFFTPESTPMEEEFEGTEDISLTTYEGLNRLQAFVDKVDAYVYEFLTKAEIEDTVYIPIGGEMSREDFDKHWANVYENLTHAINQIREQLDNGWEDAIDEDKIANLVTQMEIIRNHVYDPTHASIADDALIANITRWRKSERSPQARAKSVESPESQPIQPSTETTFAESSVVEHNPTESTDYPETIESPDTAEAVTPLAKAESIVNTEIIPSDLNYQEKGAAHLLLDMIRVVDEPAEQQQYLEYLTNLVDFVRNRYDSSAIDDVEKVAEQQFDALMTELSVDDLEYQTAHTMYEQVIETLAAKPAVEDPAEQLVLEMDWQRRLFQKLDNLRQLRKDFTTEKTNVVTPEDELIRNETPDTTPEEPSVAQETKIPPAAEVSTKRKSETSRLRRWGQKIAGFFAPTAILRPTPHQPTSKPESAVTTPDQTDPSVSKNFSLDNEPQNPTTDSVNEVATSAPDEEPERRSLAFDPDPIREPIHPHHESFFGDDTTEDTVELDDRPYVTTQQRQLDMSITPDVRETNVAFDTSRIKNEGELIREAWDDFLKNETPDTTPEEPSVAQETKIPPAAEVSTSRTSEYFARRNLVEQYLSPAQQTELLEIEPDANNLIHEDIERFERKTADRFDPESNNVFTALRDVPLTELRALAGERIEQRNYAERNNLNSATLQQWIDEIRQIDLLLAETDQMTSNITFGEAVLKRYAAEMLYREETPSA